MKLTVINSKRSFQFMNTERGFIPWDTVRNE